MDIVEVSRIIHNIADKFEEKVLECLATHSDCVVLAIQEQLYSGIDGDGNYLTPTYDADPFFDEDGIWYHRSAVYKAWKEEITPPRASSLLFTSARPVNVPNLCIDWTFYSEINAARRGDVLYVDPGNGNGPDIVTKYGDAILDMSDPAVDYFNRDYLKPAIAKHFLECGYK